MPFIPGTPEALVARSDSKNPSSTCRGVTANGLPCRRPLSKSAQSSPLPSPRKGRSPALSPAITPDAYCWQHREQHAASAAASPGGGGGGRNGRTLKERSSVDTLIERLNILEVEQKKEERKDRRSGADGSPHKQGNTSRPEKHRPKPAPTSKGFCCFSGPSEPTHAPRPVHAPSQKRTTSYLPPDKRTKTSRSRPHIERDPISQTGEFLSLIPASASPQTTALLLAELSKPVSESDEEGYIYMFWLTPESLPSEPASEVASDLLAPPSRAKGGRRTSSVLNSYATAAPISKNTESDKKTILLKIGRAANVQRRLNQWTRQCGYNLALIRYYPYHPTSNGTVNVEVRKIPCVHKVERLIHIELNARRLQGGEKCGACGREHREWFEVEAGREAVRGVDEVIRRWSGWGEKQV